MASDSMIRSLFRSLETCIHERLAMIEEVCRGKSDSSDIDRSESTGKYDELLNCIQTMESRITAIESNIQDLTVKVSVPETVHVNCIGKETVATVATVATVVQPQMWIEAMKDMEIILPPLMNSTEVSSMKAETEEEEAEEEEAEEEEAEEEEAEEEEEEAVEEEAVEEEAVEEVEEEEEAVEEEEEAEEVEEITFKNKKYYKDSSNNIYGIDDEDQPTPEPVGVWDVSRQRVLFKRTA